MFSCKKKKRADKVNEAKKQGDTSSSKAVVKKTDDSCMYCFMPVVHSGMCRDCLSSDFSSVYDI